MRISGHEKNQSRKICPNIEQRTTFLKASTYGQEVEVVYPDFFYRDVGTDDSVTLLMKSVV
jgi:hypothetical protein